MSAESAIVQETQICARESDSDGMEVDEDDAAQLPGVPVVQADSAGFDALGSLLDVVYVARDGVTQRSIGQRACYEAVRTSSLRSFARACGAVRPIVCQVDDAQRARAVGTSRQTAPRVVERTCTNEIIEEETGKTEVFAQYLHNRVDENDELRFVKCLVQDFKTLRTLGS